MATIISCFTAFIIGILLQFIALVNYILKCKAAALLQFQLFSTSYTPMVTQSHATEIEVYVLPHTN